MLVRLVAALWFNAVATHFSDHHFDKSSSTDRTTPNTSSRAMVSGGVTAATASNPDSQDPPEAGEVEAENDEKPE